MYESLTSEYTVGILLQCVFYIVGKTQYQLHVHVHMYCSIDACGQLQSTVPAAMYCGLDCDGGSPPLGGAGAASPLDGGSESVVPPCSPAPEAVSAVRAGGRRSPLHHKLIRLAAAAR